MNRNKLTIKDLVAIGVFAVIYFICMFAVGMMGVVYFSSTLLPTHLSVGLSSCSLWQR